MTISLFIFPKIQCNNSFFLSLIDKTMGIPELLFWAQLCPELLACVALLNPRAEPTMWVLSLFPLEMRSATCWRSHSWDEVGPGWMLAG